MRLLIITLFIVTIYSQERFVSDFDYTNQNYTFQELKKFIKSYPNNKLTYSDIEVIYRYCVIYEINPIIALGVMQKESDTLWNNSKEKYEWRKSRAMGYGLFKNFRRDGLKFYKYGGYEIQVYFAIKTMRKLFDEWKPGMKKEIIDLKKWVVPENASSYALLRYNPFWGIHNEYGWEQDAIGNKAFESLLPKLKTKWKEINK